jgi:hypothetical protein
MEEQFINLKNALKFIKSNGTVTNLAQTSRRFDLPFYYLSAAKNLGVVIKKDKTRHTVKAEVKDEEIYEIIRIAREYMRVAKQKSRGNLPKEVIKQPIKLSFLQNLKRIFYAIFKNNK